MQHRKTDGVCSAAEVAADLHQRAARTRENARLLASGEALLDLYAAADALDARAAAIEAGERSAAGRRRRV